MKPQSDAAPQAPAGAALACSTLSVGVPGRTLVEALELEIAGGEFVAVLGRNGTGKTLTLHALAGLREADAGTVSIAGRPAASLRRREVARHLALLPQHADDAFPATVLETVLAGRHPHIGPFEWESSRDREIALDALAQVDLVELAGRDVGTLSGGERRRAAIAQVLTQSPDVYLLDEPTNHLDPQHQLDVLQLFRARSDGGAAVLATLHDANLAVRFADRCLLLFGDGRWTLGPTSAVLNAASLSELYGTTMESLPWRDRTLFIAAGNPPRYP